jgi:hypothetical protein
MTSVFYRSIPLLLAALVAGCASSEQLAQRNEERCAAQGHQPNSVAFINCVAQVDARRQDRIDARHRETVERSSNPFSR